VLEEHVVERRAARHLEAGPKRLELDADRLASRAQGVWLRA
jgi:hypothetical protein